MDKNKIEVTLNVIQRGMDRLNDNFDTMYEALKKEGVDTMKLLRLGHDMAELQNATRFHIKNIKEELKNA